MGLQLKINEPNHGTVKESSGKANTRLEQFWSWAKNCASGLSLAVLLTIAATYLAKIPYVTIVGPMVTAIVLGISWRATIGVNERLRIGTGFASKYVLRAGIILLGARLDVVDLWHAGAKVFLPAAGAVCTGILAVFIVSRLLRVQAPLALLTSIGTGVCGAAAIAAVAPQLKSKEEDVAVGVVMIALMGTLFTVMYTLLQPVLGLDAMQFGLFAGSTLHEVAHVVASAQPFGSEALDMAVVTKLSRVLLLVPVVLLITIVQGIRLKRSREQKDELKQNSRSVWGIVRNLPIPWFIVGFAAVSGIRSLGWLSEGGIAMLISASYFLMGMGMAGLGLGVPLQALRKAGWRVPVSVFIGSVILALFGYWMAVR
ncbi:YeiH family protein [Paenibacillus sp. KN14-4R]|uniref:YeiH family protein n=1 Tax=Paenibacillus sp. KN14-4R TaxID=3445773 RepID=UPI003F9FC82B